MADGTAGSEHELQVSFQNERFRYTALCPERSCQQANHDNLRQPQDACFGSKVKFNWFGMHLRSKHGLTSRSTVIEGNEKADNGQIGALSSLPEPLGLSGHTSRWVMVMMSVMSVYERLSVVCYKRVDLKE